MDMKLLQSALLDFVGEEEGRRHTIAFVGVEDTPQPEIAGQLLDEIKASLPLSVTCKSIALDYDPEPGTLYVSFSAEVNADVLLVLEPGDRDMLSVVDDAEQPFVSRFRKVLLPGAWNMRRLLQEAQLLLTSRNLEVTGAPLIDLVKRLQDERDLRAPGARRQVLYAPLEEEWTGQNGAILGGNLDMEPHFESIREVCDLAVVSDGSFIPQLLDADIVITDYSPVMYAAWCLGKPVIFPRWLLGDAVIQSAPRSAEAAIYRDLIGHHAFSLDELKTMIADGNASDPGNGVDSLCADVVSGQGGSSARIAAVLEEMLNPEVLTAEDNLRAEAEEALADRQWAQAEELFKQLTVSNPAEVRLFDKLAHALRGQNKWWQEVATLHSALALDPDSSDLHYRLGEAQQRMGHNVAAAKAYSTALSLNPQSATSRRLHQLGLAYDIEGVDGPRSPAAAASAYAQACALDTKDKSQRFGIGALHAARGLWAEARDAYLTHIPVSPLDGELRYRAGMAYDRCYQWSEAEACYRAAIALDRNWPSWHFRLGFVLERQARYEEAADAYGYAASKSKTPKPEWYYRTGYCLEKAGRLVDACAAFAKMNLVDEGDNSRSAGPYLDGFDSVFRKLQEDIFQHLSERPVEPQLWLEFSKVLERNSDYRKAADVMFQCIMATRNHDAEMYNRQMKLELLTRELDLIRARLDLDPTDPLTWTALAETLVRAGRQEEAAGALKQALMRSDDHQPEWHFRRARLLERTGKYSEACAEFRDVYPLQQPHGTNEKKFAESANFRATATYREFYDVLPITPRTVLYESFGGVSIACNPLAVFRQIVDDPRFAGWQHIWVVDDMDVVPQDIRVRQNVTFVRKNSYLYMRHLASVEYLISNSTFPSYFVRKDGQHYLNTWHGTPLKTLGYDIKGDPNQRGNTARNFLQASLIISPNAHTEHVLLDRYGVRDIFTGRSLLTGYPRIDLLLNASEARKQQIMQSLGLDPAKPVVLFAPTFRGLMDNPDVEVDKLVADIEALDSDRYNLVFRGHYFAEKKLLGLNLPVSVAPHGIDSCELLSVVDVLVSDISSIFYDFLVTGRPVVHYLHDWDDYVEQRGVYFSKEELPGLVCEDMTSLKMAVEASVTAPNDQISERYRACREKFCALEDGKSSQRVVDAFFFAGADEMKNDPTGQILMLGPSFALNGITAASRALIQETSKAGFRNTVLVDGNAARVEGRTERIKEFERWSNVMVRVGATCWSCEEAWIDEKFRSQNKIINSTMEAAVDRGVRHEVRRLLGLAAFDVAMDFDGYRPFWARLIAQSNAKRHAIYLHNQMRSERETKFAHLDQVFAVYKGMDAIVSVSEGTNELNKELTRELGLGPERSFAVTNCIDRPGIIERSRLELDDPDFEEYRSDHRFRILNLARISPEKNQKRLVDAVRILVKEGLDVAAYVVGDGPDAAALQRYANQAGMQDHVRLLGPKENPYPFIAHADCSVLSSDHEGQSVSMIEAMILGIPCVSTALPGQVSLLANGRGLITDLTPEGVADGIATIVRKKFKPKPFDHEEHNSRAFAEFRNAMML